MIPFILASLVACATLACTAPLQAAESRPGLQACWLPGVEYQAWCGTLKRALDPAQPAGVQIDIHFAVLPALARNRKADPVLFFAGGPGQSAMELGGTVSRLLTRLANRRDLVLIDQRGTGRSAPLACPQVEATAPLAEMVDMARQLERIKACQALLQKRPYGDLRHFSTWIAVQDADAVRQALGATQVNLVGGSYGTRTALEYMRQFPKSVRRAVIDGVAPPDMVLPAAMSTDNQAAFDAMSGACQAQAACARQFPRLARDWQALLAGLPREVTVAHPLTGAAERIVMTRDTVLGYTRAALYVPALASALPLAVSEAARGRFEALLGLGSALVGRSTGRLSEGMHYAVVCAEDLPRLESAQDKPGVDFRDSVDTLYRRVCSAWPRGDVPEAFYRLPSAPAPTLVLSGGADPVTPPRHGERVAIALGPLARHQVVAQAGHGVLALPCMRDVLFRFIDAEDSAAALAVDTGCAAAIPRPPAFIPFAAGAR